MGGFFGIMLVWFTLMNFSGSVLTTRGAIPDSEMVLVLPNDPIVTGWNTFVIEMFCTFVFVMINLIVKTQKTSPTADGFLSCLAVAMTLCGMITVCGTKTGGCLNPAVAFAQTCLEWFQYGWNVPRANWLGMTFFVYMLVYIAA